LSHNETIQLGLIITQP